MKFSYSSIVAFIAAVTLLQGCAGTAVSDAVEVANQSAIDAGSPYRWEHHRKGDFEVLTKTIVGVESVTTADAELAEFTRAQIASIENIEHISPGQEPNQVRLVSVSETSSQEVWIYEFDKTTQAFVVDFETSTRGGTDVSITGPW